MKIRPWYIVIIVLLMGLVLFAVITPDAPTSTYYSAIKRPLVIAQVVTIMHTDILDSTGVDRLRDTP